MEIRPAQERDIPAIISLLQQVGEVHHRGRPDLFRAGAQKYDPAALQALLIDPLRPIFVAEEGGTVYGYAFCIAQQHRNDPVLTDIRTLYIDDLCVDEQHRGQHIGRQLYEYVCAYAKKEGYYNITLNVWSCNESAMRFYESCGLKPQKIGMEHIL